jgi:hypothetical protein
MERKIHNKNIEVQKVTQHLTVAYRAGCFLRKTEVEDTMLQ